MLKKILFSLLCLSFVRQTSCSGCFADFKLHPNITGKTCTTSTLFTLVHVKHLSTCAFRCKGNFNCASFFYSTTTQQCDGCGSLYVNSSSLTQPMADSVYYRRAIRAGTSSYSYIGCFTDTDNELIGARVMQNYKYFDQLTTSLCFDHCLDTGLQYFGTQYARECWCDDETYDVYGISNACIVACSGDVSTVCGGSLAFSVYKYTYTC